MNDRPNDLLLLAGKILTTLMQWACAFATILMALAVPLSFVFRDRIGEDLVTRTIEGAGPAAALGLPGIFIFVAAFLALSFAFFSKLNAIIGTVGDGNPFDLKNADRLNLMAWLLIAMQIVLIPAATIATFIAPLFDESENVSLTIDAGLDVEGVLLVIVLFILARVFKHGAAMRDDLEGTV